MLMIFFIVFLWIKSIYEVIDKNNRKEKSYLQVEMNSFVSKISPILGSYDIFGDYVINKEDEELISSLKKANEALTEEIKPFEEGLNKVLQVNYNRFKKLGIVRYDVYLSNGNRITSVPSINSNQKIPKVPIAENKFVKDSGEINLFVGYKNISMFVKEQKFIGTIEVLIPLSSIINAFSRFYPTYSISYLMNDNYKFEDFSFFLGERNLLGTNVNSKHKFINYTPNNEEIFAGNQNEFFEDLERDFLKNSEKNKGFSAIKKYKDKNYIVLFLPIKLSSEESIGYLVSVHENPQYAEIFKGKYSEIILINIIMLVLFIFMTLALKERNKYKNLSSIDFLTGIYNRTQFMKLGNYELDKSKRYGGKFSILLMDLDYFKKINDTYGHNFGDKILKMVSSTIRTTIRESDLLARWGGEEFICLLPNTNSTDAFVVAEKIRKQIENTNFPESLKVTISIGICEKQNEDYTIEDVTEKADKALYESKKSGRNLSTLYHKNNRNN